MRRLLLATLLLAATACATSDPVVTAADESVLPSASVAAPSPGATSLPSPEVLTAACTAAAAASAGDVEAADRAFAEAHDGLHELAADLGEIDRAVAADLLVAKQQAEAAFAADPAPADLASRLDDLVSQVRRGLETDDQPAPACS